MGAGSAGATLAARLTEDRSIRVLLVEAGPDYASAEEVPPDLLHSRGRGPVGRARRLRRVGKAGQPAVGLGQGRAARGLAE
ncbi:MAG TPA: hypothetical protein VKV73_31970 [Chloroflexota bacterium]|nr:hypothetical protein [Chloroflexota bacterium]